MKLSSIAWNAAGLGVPLLAALTAIPLLLGQLGSERFGILSLAWGLTAMAGAFDLGVGRAATKQLADHLAQGRQGQITSVAKLASRVSLVTGSATGLLFACAILTGLYRSLSFSEELEREIVLAGVVLAGIVPLQASIATYRGVSEACQRFRGISIARIGVGIANFAFPLACAHFTHHLAWLVGSLFASRLLAWFAYRWLAKACLQTYANHAPTGDTTSELRSLLNSGGWFTVGAVAGPLLVQADRFFVGSRASVADVPTYTVPFEIVTQMFLVVTAVSTVAFPTIAMVIANDPGKAWSSFILWLQRVALAMAAVAGTCALALPYILPAWVGTRLPPEAVHVGQILCIGLLTHSIGVMCFAFLHAAGRFRATALLNIAEIPFYFAALPLLIDRLGVIGAAVAWVLRVTLDAAALLYLSKQEARRRTQAHSTQN